MGLTAKQEAFVPYFADAGSKTYNNVEQSMLLAGYSVNYARHCCQHMLANVGVKNEIVKYKAEIAEKIDVNRDYLITQANLILATSDNERNKLTALSLLGDFVGAKREHAPNQEKEQARLERMDDETKRIAYELALLLTRKKVPSVAVKASDGRSKAESKETPLLGGGVPSEVES